MPRSGARLAAEAPRELAAVLAGFLSRVCAAGALDVPDRGARTPEALGLRSLPQFASLAAAQKVRLPCRAESGSLKTLGPESLSLRSVPQFASLAAAQKVRLPCRT